MAWTGAACAAIGAACYGAWVILDTSMPGWYGIWVVLIGLNVPLLARSDVVIGDGEVVTRKGFRTFREPLAGLEASMRGNALKLTREGKVISGTSPTQSPSINGQPVRDPELIIAAVRAEITKVHGSRAPRVPTEPV